MKKLAIGLLFLGNINIYAMEDGKNKDFKFLDNLFKDYVTVSTEHKEQRIEEFSTIVEQCQSRYNPSDKDDQECVSLAVQKKAESAKNIVMSYRNLRGTVHGYPLSAAFDQEFWFGLKLITNTPGNTIGCSKAAIATWRKSLRPSVYDKLLRFADQLRRHVSS